MFIKNYYELMKPGLVYGNLITTIAGFLLASAVYHIPLNWTLLALTAAGLFFVMASGCVFNNYIDRDIDIKMARTKDRALVTGKISGRAALVFGVILAALGFGLLFVYTNMLALFAAFVGFFFYVFMYSLWWKRRSPAGTFVGAIAGATPPVVGYAAAYGRFDLAAGLLFVVLVIWQMPHFYAIAIRRFGDYMAAGVPVLPVKRGIPATKKQMLAYVVLFVLMAPLLTLFGFVGYIYLAVVLVLGFIWLVFAVKGMRSAGPGDDVRWARGMFLWSLTVMTLTFITLALASVWK